MKPIRIVLIDDHTLFRNGVKALLSRQTDCEIIGEAADGLSGVKLVEQIHPDIVLLDLDMPVMNGLETLEQILSSRPEQTVLMLTVSEDPENLTECMRLGASGFLLKNVDTDYLVDAVKRAHQGDTVFSPEMTEWLVKSLLNPAKAKATPLDTLTARELEILGHISAGHSNKIIARRLDLAETTVKVHVQNILRKLELESRVQAAVYAVQHNVPQPDSE